jgi:hypothetical protein
MSVVFTVFHVEMNPEAPRVREFLGYIKAGQAALAATNPTARYVVLTDAATAPLLDKHVEVAVRAPSAGPLMLRYLAAQANFERTDTANFTVLAATDCAANRDLTKATSRHHGFVTTLNKAGKVNNVAYIRDHELAARFLTAAAAELENMPAEKQKWFGDQESWDAVLGDTRSESDKDGILVAPFRDRAIHLYPWTLHNHFVPNDGFPKKRHKGAYLLHFKGPRKKNMERYVQEYILKPASV